MTSIDYDQADCGYGVGQVTDGMTAASTKYTANGKTKIALDYAENVAAAIQILAGKWNELRAANIIANNGDPTALENWYFAIWAYNSGLYPNTGGPWGLGWTNNPMNADYPANRAPFLRNTYADAAEPWKWPYQEKVFGWMETPILISGQPAYVSSGYLTIPGGDTFCVMARNECNPSYIDPDPAPPDQS